jgi:hypothetical protein
MDTLSCVRRHVHGGTGDVWSPEQFNMLPRRGGRSRGHARRGAIAIEITLNMLIYTIVFMVLFQLAMVPLQQFFIQTASRSAALLYVQLRHAGDAKDTQKTMVVAMLRGSELEKALNGGRSVTIEPLVTTEDLVRYYVKVDLFGDTATLPGKLFDASRIDMKCAIDPPEHEGFFGGIADYFVNLVNTRQVTVTITYSREFIQGLWGSLPPLSIKGEYVCRYAP